MNNRWRYPTVRELAALLFFIAFLVVVVDFAVIMVVAIFCPTANETTSTILSVAGISMLIAFVVIVTIIGVIKGNQT